MFTDAVNPLLNEVLNHPSDTVAGQSHGGSESQPKGPLTTITTVGFRGLLQRRRLRVGLRDKELKATCCLVSAFPCFTPCCVSCHIRTTTKLQRPTTCESPWTRVSVGHSACLKPDYSRPPTYRGLSACDLTTPRTVSATYKHSADAVVDSRDGGSSDQYTRHAGLRLWAETR